MRKMLYQQGALLLLFSLLLLKANDGVEALSVDYLTNTTETLTCPAYPSHERRQLTVDDETTKLRGTVNNEQQLHRELQEWGWYDSWNHYFCGERKEVKLKDTGLLDDIERRMTGENFIDKLKDDICNNNKKSGSWSSPRPSWWSDTYWLGGFKLTWKVTKTVVCPTCCGETHTVEVKFDDIFDPGWKLIACALLNWPFARSRWEECIDDGKSGDYHVTHMWTYTIFCPKTCAPAPSPNTPSPQSAPISKAPTLSEPTSPSPLPKYEPTNYTEPHHKRTHIPVN